MPITGTLLSVVTILGSGGLAAIVASFASLKQARSESAKNDIMGAIQLLSEHRRDNAALREDIGVLRAQVETNREEANELRRWAIEHSAWDGLAVTEVTRLGGHIEAPPRAPDRRVKFPPMYVRRRGDPSLPTP